MRIAAGKTQNEVADAVGMSTNEYWDLEAYDDEIIDVLSVDTAKKVAKYFQLSLLQLLVPDKSSWPTKSIVSAVLVEEVRHKINALNISNETAEDKVGWYLKGFFADPQAYIDENPIMFLIDLAKFLKIEWLSIIPKEINR